ncbi:MAG: CoA transferase [Gammaproteobacteria bacterium]|nr:CoA transferase [Gammaproteobacteria bacterium]
MTGPLPNVRVLDLSRVLAGPWASQTLADLGAEVIKIERPRVGDDTRSWGPPFLKDQDGNETRESAYFLAANRGKLSVTINVAEPEGQAVIRRLAEASDVFIENYKVGDMARYGLSYEDLKRINPRLIYCSVTGFGQDGPMAHLPGYDFVIQGIGGLMSITGERDDLPGGGPQKVGVAVSDIMTGLYATIAILAALAHRSETGEGQHIDLALLDTQVATIASMGMNYLASGVIPKRQGNAHANIVPYQVFHAQDGDLVIAVGNDGQFTMLCELIGASALAVDERFSLNDNRVRNREILVPLLQEILSKRTVSEWITVLQPGGIPCGPINNIAQTFEHPQVRHRRMRLDLEHASAGATPSIANPIKLSGTPISYDKAPPTLGQHTKHVLTTIGGLSEAEIALLAAKGIV